MVNNKIMKIKCREQLIYYSLKYQGEYAAILKALKEDETYGMIPNIDCITMLDEEYPAVFWQLAYPPFVLYYKGRLELLSNVASAVIGSRNYEEYAANATRKLIKRLNCQGRVIVSGLALGIDIIAQKAAKDTIGILGSGIDNPYPLANASFIKECFQKQLVLSEYPGKALPLKHHFPIRNRLIAALAKEIYVMQATRKSGTMTTVSQAMDLNRDIYALPYPVFDKAGLACNELISEGAGMIIFD